jgi:hypothetical protein
MGNPDLGGEIQDKMRAGLLLAAALLGAASLERVAVAQSAGQCSKVDFEAVVDEAGAALRTLAQQNTPQFQARLRQLKQRRGWSDEQFLKEAEPLVRDDRIAAFDQKSEDLLARITGAGQAAPPGGAPNCALLAGLRDSMTTLIETQKAKWAYMFERIDAELRR